jgi:RND family efflux transporter MFP subunit
MRFQVREAFGRPLRRGCLAALGIAVSVAGAAGCAKLEAKPPPAKPPAVVTDVPIEREVSDYEYFVGQTMARKSVDVRARVNGYLDKVNFADGDEVKEGIVLFEIDSRSYDAEVARTEAALVQAEAHAHRLEADYQRARSLKGRDVLSQAEFDVVAGDYSEAKAAVGIAKANRDLAKLNQGFTHVVSPIEGRISRRMVDPGNLVKTDETLLTNIVTLDPVYVYFDIDERTLLRLRRLVAEGKIQSRSETELKVDLALADEQGFPHQGTVDFSDNKVDQTTGTLRVRASVPNPKPRVLSPGMFMRVRLPVGKPHMAILVPEKAIGTDQGRKFVYVVKPGKDKEGKPADIVEYRPITVGSQQEIMIGTRPEQRRVVEKGIAPGERVVVSGLQRVRPGIAVTAISSEELASSPTNSESAKSAAARTGSGG